MLFILIYPGAELNVKASGDPFRIISTVKITDIDTPVAGCTADSSANVSGTGITDGTAVLSWEPSDSIYQPGTVYTAVVVLRTEPGYRFDEHTTATVNGEAASMVVLNANGTMSVQTVFAATEGTSSTTDTTDTEPEAGQNDGFLFGIGIYSPASAIIFLLILLGGLAGIFLWRILRKE
jgi:hypothetical protein